MPSSPISFKPFFDKSPDHLLVLSKADYSVLCANRTLQSAFDIPEDHNDIYRIFKNPDQLHHWLQQQKDTPILLELTTDAKLQWECSSDDEFHYLTGREIQANSKTTDEEMQSIFDAFPDLGFKITRDGTYLNYYSGLTPTFIPPNEFLGKKIIDIMPSDIATNQMELLKTCIDLQKTITAQYTLPYPDGLHYFDSKYIPLSDGNCFVIVRDTTDYKFTQELLEESQSKANIGSWELDIDTEKVFWTDEVYRIHGFDLKEKEKIQTGLKYYHLEDQKTLRESIIHTIKHQSIFEQKLRVYTKNRDLIWTNTIGYPVIGAEGRVVKVRGTFQDIQHNETIKIELEQNKKTLQLLIKYTPAAVAMFDKEMRYIAYSDRWLKDYNIKIDSIKGMSHYDVFPDIKEEWKKDHQRVLKGEIYSNMEDEWQRVDGSIFYLKYVLRPWRDENGLIGGLIMFTEVITEQVETRIRLEKSVAELTRSNEELEQFAYVSSHDLQEPLRMIGNFSQLLKKRYHSDLDDKGKQYLDIIFDSAKRMKALIKNLLDYSRMNQISENPKKVDLQELIQSKIDDLSLLIQEKNAKIEFQNLPNYIYCAPNKIGLVFYNLILNAIKFNDKANPIIILAYKPNTKAHVFCIVDNGIGLDPQQSDRIFKIFQRLHTKKTYTGTGIGLAICKKVIEQMGGEIWYEPNESGGTTFSFSITKH